MKRKMMVLIVVSLFVMAVGGTSVSAQEKIAVANATQEQLEKIPGMTPEMARDIIKHRDGFFTGVKAKFKKPEDLTKRIESYPPIMTVEQAREIGKYLDFETLKGF